MNGQGTKKSDRKLVRNNLQNMLTLYQAGREVRKTEQTAERRRPK